MQELINEATYFIWNQMGFKIKGLKVGFFLFVSIRAHMCMLCYYTQLKKNITRLYLFRIIILE